MATPIPNSNSGAANRLPVAWQEISTATGTITAGKEFVLLSYAGATAVTLAAPTLDMNGLILEITSSVAQAHVVTATNLINGDNDTLTWGGAVGDSCSLRAWNKEWLTGYLVNVTVG